MLDVKVLREDPNSLKEMLNARGSDTSVVDDAVDFDKKKRECIVEADSKKAERNSVSKDLGQKKRRGEDISADAARMKEVSGRIKQLDQEISRLDTALIEILEQMPNFPHSSVPQGQTDEENLEVGRWGEMREPGDWEKAHWDLGPDLGILDFERASKICGSRFWLLRGAGARLERALINFMLSLHTEQHGYEEIMAPSLVLSNTLYGTGQLPRFAEDLFRCEGQDMYLIPTSEVPLTAMHAGEILADDDMNISYCGFSPCFRSEAGAAGKDTRGLVRVHQFHKVELVKMCKPEDSYNELDSMVADAQKVLELLELPYRTVDICLGDLGFTAAKKFDLEFWSPVQQRFIEISSCSNCTDFQARRANIKFRRKNGKKEFVHTLNGSGLAVGRTMVAVLENHQQEDGSVKIPKALQPFYGADSIKPPAT
jgi:seryl-tRNA synthetase